jgi:hypothetical protein
MKLSDQELGELSDDDLEEITGGSQYKNITLGMANTIGTTTALAMSTVGIVKRGISMLKLPLV